MNGGDVWRAFRTAEKAILSEHRTGPRPERTRVFMIVVGLLTLFAGLGVFVYRANTTGSSALAAVPPKILVSLIGALGVVAVAAALRRLRG